MYDRTERVRQRERLFLDTIDEHYDQFYKDASTPYNGWRENAREEAIEVKELTKSAHWRTGMGVASILASVVYGSSHGGEFTERMLRDAVLYIGVDMLRTSQVRKQEKQIHQQQLEELNGSFDDSIKPVVVAIQGTEHRLTGTADAQYNEWRDLLRQIFIEESGFVPDDLTVYAGEVGAGRSASRSASRRRVEVARRRHTVGCRGRGGQCHRCRRCTRASIRRQSCSRGRRERTGARVAVRRPRAKRPLPQNLQPMPLRAPPTGAERDAEPDVPYSADAPLRSTRDLFASAGLRLIERVGVGGSSEVWRALDTRERSIALKIPPLRRA